MDRDTIALATDFEALRRFAYALHDRMAATRVLLFDSRARCDEHEDSDYDVIIVSPRFAVIPRAERSLGIRELWSSVGGEGSMDLICLTPEEFEVARHRISLIAEVLPETIDLLAAEDVSAAGQA